MAMLPCSIGPHRNVLKNFYVYYRWGRGEDMQGRRLRLCPKHITAVQEDLSEFEVDPESGAISGGDAATANCLACGKPVGEGDWQLFVTGYVSKNERKDYWSHVHVNCTLPESLSPQWGDPL